MIKLLLIVLVAGLGTPLVAYIMFGETGLAILCLLAFCIGIVVDMAYNFVSILFGRLSIP